MLRSMTGYGRAVRSFSFGRLVVEVQSVNRRHLEMVVVLPKELLYLEAWVRRQLAATIKRGALTYRLQASYSSQTPVRLSLNLPLLRQKRALWEEVAREIGAPPSLNLSLFATEEELFLQEAEPASEEVWRRAVEEVSGEALAALLTMKREEGEALERDLCARLTTIRSLLQSIASTADSFVARVGGRLRAKLEELLSQPIEDDERLAKELCLYAERADISEETTRLASHFDQFERAIGGGEGCCGKPLEFLLQEMQREATTICSKVGDVAAIHNALAIKAEVERMREQVQNIE